MSKKHVPDKQTPCLHTVPGDPVTAWDMINKYGTYNIQPTSDTENAYPAIAAGEIRHPEDVPSPRQPERTDR